jgi:hypothetical protein
MKQNYTAPTVMSIGGAVGETMCGPGSGTETFTDRPLAVGAVGFYL